MGSVVGVLDDGLVAYTLDAAVAPCQQLSRQRIVARLDVLHTPGGPARVLEPHEQGQRFPRVKVASQEAGHWSPSCDEVHQLPSSTVLLILGDHDTVSISSTLSTQ